MFWTRKQKSTDRKSARRLRVEKLDAREMMAGDVSVAVANGNLNIQANNTDNSVQVAPYTAGRWIVTSGDTINGQRRAFVTPVITGDLNVQMGGGNDRLSISGLVIPGRLNVALDDAVAPAANATGADGNDTFTLSATRVVGASNVLGGGANDRVIVSAVHFVGATSMDLGDGNDVLTTSFSRYSGAVAVQFGAGNDEAYAFANVFSAAVNADGGAGTDKVRLNMFNRFAVAPNFTNFE